ncbi:MAG: hypothetical protein C0502_08365 [Opitutus sp.]|nr:hypothetical protein [Opitutus sp.]
MAIPLKIRDLLVREAHLRLGREAIAPILAEREAEWAGLQKSKPGLFAAKEAKAAHAQALRECEETLRLLRNGIAQLDRVEPHLRRLVVEAAEDHCRENSPEYLRALAIRERRADWDRCLQRFAEKAYGFTQALGNVRNMVTSGYQRHEQVYSQAALQAFLLAIEAGRRVEDEIRFANDVADVQARILSDSRLSALELPKLRTVNYSQWVALISNMTLAEAQPQFDQIIAEAKRLCEETLPQLQAQAGLADASQTAALDSFVLQALGGMREEARALVNPEDTETSVADSERMLAALAKKTVLGRLPAPA